ncbi:hypothetical protein [Streptosporangium sp. NPDC002524]|uniref:hypothetical protein n=1 Tax=Streptosporangium sp. NPDC002524 TaxID=3154537 RepID=UPI003331833E
MNAKRHASGGAHERRAAEEVGEAPAEAVRRISTVPRRAASVPAAIQSPAALTSGLTGPMPLNLSAACSDHHVSGLNPAGNASLTGDAFVSGRFRVTRSRRPAVSHPR